MKPCLTPFTCAFLSCLFLFPSVLHGSCGEACNFDRFRLRVRGDGSFPGRPFSRNVIRAREAARIEAEAALREVIASLAFDSSRTIGEVFSTRHWADEFVYEVRSLIRRAHILDEGRRGRRSYYVVLELDLEKVRRLLPDDDEHFLRSVYHLEEVECHENDDPHYLRLLSSTECDT